jgi:hypothetical protein
VTAADPGSAARREKSVQNKATAVRGAAGMGPCIGLAVSRNAAGADPVNQESDEPGSTMGSMEGAAMVKWACPE